MPRFFARARHAFSLIELVVVLMILTALATFVISNLGSFGRTADMVSTATNQADLAEQVGLYFVVQKRYPQGMDSLLVSGGTAIYGPLEDDGSGGLQAATSESTQIRGLPISGPSLYRDLAPATLTDAANASFARSFTRCGFDFVFDHDNSVLDSNNSGVVQRALDRSNPIPVAEVAQGSVVATRLVPTGPSGAGTWPATERVVALGIGPNNSMIPETMLNAPVYPGNDGSYYGRYVAFFRVFANGERARLIGVSDAYGRTPDYTRQQLGESLPDGSRQG